MFTHIIVVVFSPLFFNKSVNQGLLVNHSSDDKLMIKSAMRMIFELIWYVTYFRSKTRCTQYLGEGLLAVVAYPLLILPPPVVALERSGLFPKF